MRVVYNVSHKTEFRYADEVSVSQQLLRLTPRETYRQLVIESAIEFSPAANLLSTDTDFFGNWVSLAGIQDRHRELVINATSTVQVRDVPEPDLLASAPWEDVAEQMLQPLDVHQLQAAAFCHASPHVDIVPGLSELTRDIFTARRPLLDAVQALTSRIHSEFKYVGGVTDVHTAVATILDKRVGVCQDFAHLQIACLRYLGLPARYVSGYLLTVPPPGQAKLTGSDESHAWLAVWAPQVGWVEFDPTNNLMPATEHIVLGWGRDYADVSPVNGVIVGGGSHSLDVSVDVSPVK